MPFADVAARRQYSRDWKLQHPERARYSNKCADAAAHANERAALYGAPGTLTGSDVRDCLSAGACHYCAATDRLGIDHVIPLHAQGPNTRDNIVACCQPCNASKHRADRPGRWSRLHETCIDCGGSDRPHRAHGLCGRCFARLRWHVEKGNASWPAAA